MRTINKTLLLLGSVNILNANSINTDYITKNSYDFKVPNETLADAQKYLKIYNSDRKCGDINLNSSHIESCMVEDIKEKNENV
jgi:hypothetical protein